MTILTTIQATVVATLNAIATRWNRLLGDSDDDEEETNAPQILTGIAFGMNSFAHAVKEAMDRDESISVDYEVVSEPDIPMASNPLKVLDMLPQVRETVTDNRRRLGDRVAGQINVYSHAGTGWLLWNHIADQLNLGPNLNWLVGSTELLRYARSNGEDLPPARRRLLSALGTVHIGPGTVIQDQDLQTHGFSGVPKEVATELKLAAMIDWTNYQTSTNLIAHKKINIGNNNAGIAQQDAQAGQEIQREAQELEFTFEPAAWAWWRDDPRDDLPVTDRTEVIALLPTEYDDVNGAGQEFDPHYGDVEAPHIFKLRRVDDCWLEEIKREAVEHIDERIRAGDNSIAYEWKNMCKQFGESNPVERWERYRENHLDPKLETDSDSSE